MGMSKLLRAVGVLAIMSGVALIATPEASATQLDLASIRGGNAHECETTNATCPTYNNGVPGGGMCGGGVNSGCFTCEDWTTLQRDCVWSFWVCVWSTPQICGEKSLGVCTLVGTVMKCAPAGGGGQGPCADMPYCQ